MRLKIPAGIEEGSRLRSSGNGDAGARGGPMATSTCRDQIKPHEIFERDGHDLHCEVPLELSHRRARRRNQRAHARRQGQRQSPRRHPERHDLPPARQGHESISTATARATSTSMSRSPCPPSSTASRRKSCRSSPGRSASISPRCRKHSSRRRSGSSPSARGALPFAAFLLYWAVIASWRKSSASPAARSSISLTYMGQLAALLANLGGAVRTGVWRLRLVAQQSWRSATARRWW